MDRTIKGFAITNEDLVEINRFTKRELSEDEVYTFSVILCDNEIDRDFERFNNASLDEITKLFIGKTGIFDHDAKGKNQTARIYSAEMITDPSKKNSLNEPYSYVKANAYMVKSPKTRDLMLEIDGGIKKEVSVSCSVSAIHCSICGADQKKGSCSHKKGKTYDNKCCHHALSGVVDAYEWSFVAIPAQKNAGVTKAFNQAKEVNSDMQDRNFIELKKAFSALTDESITLTKAEVTELLNQLDRFSESSRLGKEYQDDLICEVKRLSFLVNDSLPVEVINSVTCKMDIAELKAFKQAYEQKLENISDNVQLHSTQNCCVDSTNQFKI